jgi:polyisoprenoid-binding protein YceI
MTTLETLLLDPDLAGVWNLALDRSAVTFKIKTLWGLLRVKGRFTEFSGNGQLAANGAVYGRLDIRVASLRTGIARRDEHLCSADFFDVERYPDISVVVTALHPTAGNAAELRANFTVKGNNEPVPLPVRVTELDDGAVRISGETRVNRAQFGLAQFRPTQDKLGLVSATVTVAADTIFVRAPQ